MIAKQRVLAKKVCMSKAFMFALWNLRLLFSSLIVNMILVCTRFYLVVLTRISKPQCCPLNQKTNKLVPISDVFIWCDYFHWAKP